MNGWFRRFGTDQSAVSPVIGTILVLFIVLIAVAGILVWGVPAIQGIQAHSEFQAVLTQFVELNADIKNLRDPQSSKRDTISVNRGLLSLEQGGRWVFTGTNDTNYKTFNLTGWTADASTSVSVSAPNIPGTHSVYLDKVVGATATEMSSCASSCGAASLSLGTTGGVANTIKDYSYRIRAKEGSSIKAEAWIINVGRISYALDNSQTLNRVYATMGAVINRQGAALFMEDPPAIKEPDFAASPPDKSFFARVVDLDGSSAGSGKGRFPVLVNLVDVYGLSKGRTTFEQAVSARIQVNDGNLLQEAFCTYLSTRKYYVQQAGACSAGTVNVLYDPGQTFVYDLSHMVVNGIVQSQ